jgi:glucan phosphoethanolaminetransferase (alkaline phosphatase superfamily)
MFRKLLSHFYLALIFFILTLGQQYLFYYTKEIPIVWLTFGKYLGVFAFLIAATFIKPRWLRFIFLGFVFLLNYFQMAHLSYFGTQILPNEIYLFLTQYHEIHGTLVHELRHVLFPLSLTIVPTIIGIVSVNRINNIYTFRVMGILFCLYFAYNPIRTFVTGNTWGRQPSTRELGGMNVYLSISYFTGKILPHKIGPGKSTKASNTSSELKVVNKTNLKWDKVIIVLGESLSPHHMSLFGYHKPTTPFLESIKDNPHFFHSVGLSGGVSTDIAVAFFLNMGFGEVGSTKAATGEHCLFKLAKSQDYTTHFLSIQSSQQLRYIAPYLCASSLQDYKSLEDISPETEDHQAARDRDLIGYFRKIFDFDTKQFVFLHQRGSHAPWELRSTDQSRVFPHDGAINHYDNSVVEFDLFMRDLHGLLSSSNKKVLMVYVSDHGEALGIDGEWGHGRLARPSFEIPVLIHSYNQELPAEVRSLPKYLTHYNLALFIAQELGHELNQRPSDIIKDYMIYGNDIDGFAGKAEISFEGEDFYNFKVIE